MNLPADDGAIRPDAVRELVTLADGSTVVVRSVEPRCRRAREEGVTALRAEFLSENRALPALLRRFGGVEVTTCGPTSTAALDLTRAPEAGP